jgi:PAS domain S-box-containing protein
MVTVEKGFASGGCSDAPMAGYFHLGLIGAVTSPAKQYVEVNEQLCEILGYPRAELLRMTWAELTDPEDLGVDVANFNRVLAGELNGYAIDKRWVRKDGRIIDSTIVVRAVRRADRTVEYFVALLQELTQRRRWEAATRQA